MSCCLPQAEGSNSDTYLQPRKLYPDPFRGGANILVMCDTFRLEQSTKCREVSEKAPTIL